MSDPIDRMEEIVEAPPDVSESPATPTFTSRLGPLLTSLARVRTVVGLTAGAISITGALLSYTGYSKPAAAGTGRLVAVVRDRHDAHVGDAVVEVLTAEKAVVTTLAGNSQGRASVPIAPGAYIVQVRHPRLGSATRVVEIRAGLTAEVRVMLPGSLSAGAAIPYTRTGAGAGVPAPHDAAAPSPSRRPRALAGSALAHSTSAHQTPPSSAPAASPSMERRRPTAATPGRGGGQAP